MLSINSHGEMSVFRFIVLMLITLLSACFHEAVAGGAVPAKVTDWEFVAALTARPTQLAAPQTHPVQRDLMAYLSEVKSSRSACRKSRVETC